MKIMNYFAARFARGEEPGEGSGTEGERELTRRGWVMHVVLGVFRRSTRESGSPTCSPVSTAGTRAPLSIEKFVSTEGGSEARREERNGE